MDSSFSHNAFNFDYSYFKMHQTTSFSLTMESSPPLYSNSTFRNAFTSTKSLGFWFSTSKMETSRYCPQNMRMTSSSLFLQPLVTYPSFVTYTTWGFLPFACRCCAWRSSNHLLLHWGLCCEGVFSKPPNLVDTSNTLGRGAIMVGNLRLGCFIHTKQPPLHCTLGIGLSLSSTNDYPYCPKPPSVGVAWN